MRKLMVIIAFICSTAAGAYAKDTAIQVYVDNQRVKLDPPAIMRDSKAYVGLRGITTALKATTKWDEKTKTAIITVGNKRTRIAQSDGITINGILYLPLRNISEALDCKIKWVGIQKAVKIHKEAPCPAGGG